MNNLAYNSEDASFVGPKVEQKVREELIASGSHLDSRILTLQVATQRHYRFTRCER